MDRVKSPIYVKSLEGDVHEFEVTDSETVRDFKEIFAGVHADIPLVCVCGNHDVGDVPTRSTLARYEALWGADHQAFDEGSVRFVVLDSQLYFNASEPGISAT